eukprot:CAMPEP_0170548242 /NCGR_PEP_ID=MMETSP0211-20121228/6574_1 /TAXON_ID=311385 /ORGANISM="Pseudokeronopsis sp., Strain OXSARD2" /LENGTH=47 /DNA_ID= /DNA_START= /DNA_END= /DNA_ORIENTATION=
MVNTFQVRDKALEDGKQYEFLGEIQEGNEHSVVLQANIMKELETINN